MVAQRGGGGGGVGGGGLNGSVGPNTSGGVQEKDELKNFHHAMAVQATSQQSAEFSVVVKNTEAAQQELEELLSAAGKGAEKGSDAAGVSRLADTLRQTIEKARLGTQQFLVSMTPAQKNGLKEITGRMQRADSDLGEQEKALEPGGAGAKAGTQEEGIGSAERGERLRKGLGAAIANFRSQQSSLAVEMGIVESSAIAGGAGLRFSVPPYKSSVKFAGGLLALTNSAVMSRVSAEGGQNVFKVEATTDLTDLQESLVAILGAQLNKSERCGERLQVLDAKLTPDIPIADVEVQLHYERWLCRQVAGGTTSNEMADANATVEVRLTPGVGAHGEIEVATEMVRVDADKFLGDLLRKDELGTTVRGTIAKTVASATANFDGVLPPAAKDVAQARSARFESSGAGDLSVVVSGEMRISEEQTKLLDSQLKERLASRAVAPATAVPPSRKQ
jgi:hypothetical protein